jgi:hypothetical protein
VLALLAGMAACANAASQAITAPGAARSTAVTSNQSIQDLVRDARERLRHARPATGAFVILILPGAGEAATAATQALRRALEADGVVLARVEQRQLGPVADTAVPGSHVNETESSVTPRPTLVVRISEGDGKLWIATRQPGADPVGGDEPWMWVISVPLAQASTG